MVQLHMRNGLPVYLQYEDLENTVAAPRQLVQMGPIHQQVLSRLSNRRMETDMPESDEETSRGALMK